MEGDIDLEYIIDGIKYGFSIVIIIIICGIYIVPYSARSWSKVLYNIIIPDSNLFPPSTYLNSQGSIQCILPL